MKKINFLIVPLMLASVACSKKSSDSGLPDFVPITQPAKVYTFDTNVYWSDEFNTDGAPDPSKWQYDTGGSGWGNHELEYYTNTGITSGAWGRGGLVRTPKSILAQTADGPYDPAAGKFGDSVVAVTPKNFRLQDSFTPPNFEYLNKTDLDLGSGNPVVFPFEQSTLAAAGNTRATSTEIVVMVRL